MWRWSAAKFFVSAMMITHVWSIDWGAIFAA